MNGTKLGKSLPTRDRDRDREKTNTHHMVDPAVAAHTVKTDDESRWMAADGDEKPRMVYPKHQQSRRNQYIV